MKKYKNSSFMMGKATKRNGSTVINIDKVSVYGESLETVVFDILKPLKYYINTLREIGEDPSVLYILDSLAEHQEYKLACMLEGITNSIGPVTLNLAMFNNDEDIKGNTVVGVELESIP